MSEKHGQLANLQGDDEDANGVASSEWDPAIAERASRLRDAVRAGGGNKAVAQRAGMPVGTLNNYVGGRDMKASALVALAVACGVRLEWLATGQGPMTPSVLGSMQAGDELAGDDTALPRLARVQARSGVAEPGPGGEAAPHLGITWQVNPDRLARAYETALAGLATPVGRRPDAKRLMQVTLLIYDEMTEAEEATKSPLPSP